MSRGNRNKKKNPIWGDLIKHNVVYREISVENFKKIYASIL